MQGGKFLQREALVLAAHWRRRRAERPECARFSHSWATGACLKPDIQRGEKVKISGYFDDEVFRGPYEE